MNKVNIFILIFISVFVLIFVSSCSKLEITEEMQTAIDEYITAISKSELRQAGKVYVKTVIDDKAIEHKTTESTIDFDYEIIDDKVVFDRIDRVNGIENASYVCNGDSILAFDYSTNEWVDKTEANTNFLSRKTNPFVTLSLFRVDSNTRIRTEYLTGVKSNVVDGYRVIEFTLKDSTLSDVLGFYKADGIVRESDGHTRTYYIDSDGYVSKIIISTKQNIISNGEKGEYSSNITVTIS